MNDGDPLSAVAEGTKSANAEIDEVPYQQDISVEGLFANVPLTKLLDGYFQCKNCRFIISTWEKLSESFGRLSCGN